MLSKNLRYYRLKRSMTKKALALACGLSPMAITNYENGTRNPDMDTLKKLARALDITVSDFLAVRNTDLVFKHGEFRKTSTLTQASQEYIRESVEEYFSRFFTAVELLGGDILPESPECSVLELNEDIERSAELMRRHLGLAAGGPVRDLIPILEDKGILVYVFDIQNEKFSGMNGFVNDRPYIIVNGTMCPEQNRSTTAHELAHLLFKWPDGMSESDIENTATAISGAFLFPEKDALRELGIHRNHVSNDMTLVCKEYGISMSLLIKRAEKIGIITKKTAHDLYNNAVIADWRTNEPVRIPSEKNTLFEQLVYRAISEEEISIQKGAELLQIPYSVIAAQCFFGEDQ